MFKRLSGFFDLVLVISIGVLVLVISALTLNHSSGFLVILRWIVGLGFVYFCPGYVLSVLLYPKGEHLSWGERVILSVGLSLLSTYPLGFINVVREGRENVYQSHLLGLLSIYVLATLLLAGLALWKELKHNITLRDRLPSYSKNGDLPNLRRFLLLGVILVSMFFNFGNLSMSHLETTEIDEAVRSYNLTDGALVGRRAYMLSTKSHGPLHLYITHATSSILNPRGLYESENWMFRLASAFVGTLTVLTTYLLGREFLGEKVGLLSSFLLAISNYHVSSSRFYVNETFLPFFMTLSAYFYLRSRGKTDVYISGAFLGASLLGKITGGLLVPVFLSYSLIRRNDRRPLLRLFSVALAFYMPIIIFNVGAFLLTGYLDIPFGKLAHLLGFDVPLQNELGGIYDTLRNPIFGAVELLNLLVDQYSLPLFCLYAASLVYFLVHPKGRAKLSLFSLWALITLAFFSINGIRFYYVNSITIPLSLLAGQMIVTTWKMLKRKTGFQAVFLLLVFLVLCYSALYTYNSNISPGPNYHYGGGGELGGTRGPLLIPDLVKYPYSRIVKTYQECSGFPKVKEFLRQNAVETDLIIADDKIHLLNYWWYIKIGGFKIQSGRYLHEMPQINGEPTVLLKSQVAETDFSKFPTIFYITQDEKDSLPFQKLAQGYRCERYLFGDIHLSTYTRIDKNRLGNS